jgi:hypothetical protein
MAPGAGHSPLSSRWLPIGRWFVLAIALVVMGMAYLNIGRLLIAQTNNTDKDILGADQKHNMKLALQTRADLTPDWSKGVSQPVQDWFPHRADGVVNPLWPWIAAWLADKDHTISGPEEVTDQDRAFFNRGRSFHLGWTLGALVILGIACARNFTLAGSLVIVLLVGFGALLPRSAYFQPEPVFFVLFGITWFTCLKALHRNALWTHALLGVFGGLAYLAKGSVEPLLLAYIGISTLRWAWGWFEVRRRLADDSGVTLWLRRNHWLALLLMAVCYLMTAGPRLSYAYQTYGNAFHSYPSYWMWFDDFKDCYTWMGTHNTKEALTSMKPTEKPSYSNYAASHTREQMVTRLIDGTKTKVMELLWPGVTTISKKNPKPWKGVLELRGVYLGSLAALLVVLGLTLRFAVPRPEHAAHRLHPETVSQVLFVVGTFIGYSLAYGWYTPIGRGDRFMLSLYAPLVISIVWGCEGLLRRALRRNASPWFMRGYQFALWLLSGAIAWRSVEILQFPYFRN